MPISATAPQATRLCVRTLLACSLAYPLIATALRLSQLLPMHPIDAALTAGLFVVVVITSLACWLAGAYRALLFSNGVLLTASALTTALVLIGD